MHNEKYKLEFNGQVVHVYKRERSRYWQCSTCIDGYNHRSSTRATNLAMANAAAEEWYLGLRLDLMRAKRGEPILAKQDQTSGALVDKRLRRARRGGPTLRMAIDKFLEEYPILTNGERNEKYAKGHGLRLNGRIATFFGEDRPLAEITEGEITKYRAHRMSDRINGKPPSHTTVNHDIIALRLALKTAKRHGMIEVVPDMSAPYSRSTKVVARPWFSPEEYRRLVDVARDRAKNPKSENHRKDGEDLFDQILFAANSGLRPDELFRIQVQDCNVTEEGGKKIVLIRVSEGKRGFRYCKTMPGAVEPLRRALARRPNATPSDRVFPVNHRDLLNDILKTAGLKFSRDGQRRSLYSLRHSYLSFRLMEGADIYGLSKNCGTSVEMIQKFYASHIAQLVDASAINVTNRKARTSASFFDVQ